MSIWDSAARHQLVAECRKNPEAARIYIDILGKLREGFYDSSIVDVILQRYDAEITIEEAYCFGKLFAEIGIGLIHVQSFEIGESPRADKERLHNHNALQQLRRQIHVATLKPLELKVAFFGGAGDQDGYVELRSDLIFARESCQDGCCPAMRSVAPKRTWFPLEVGTTTAARTLGHIRQERGLVRWPYNSTKVFFLYVPGIFDLTTRNHPYALHFPDELYDSNSTD